MKMDCDMQFYNEDSNSCSAKKIKKRKRKNRAPCVSNNTNQEGVSLTQDVLPEKESCVESTVDISSNSGLVEVESGSNMKDNNKKVREKNKMKKALNNANKDFGLQEVASETNTPHRIEMVNMSVKQVSEKNSCASTANVSSNSSLIELQYDSNLNRSEDKKKRKMEKKRSMALKAAEKYVGVQEVAFEINTPNKIDVPVDVSAKPVSEKNSCVESTANVSSVSSLIDMQSDSNLNHSEDKKKRKQEKKRRMALKAGKKYVGVQEVASEANTPHRTEGLVDVSTKLVSEKNSSVESTANVSSISSLIEVQSVSNLNCSGDTRKRKKEKNKRRAALKAAKKDVGVQEVPSETKTPLRIEVPVDVSAKLVSEKNSYVESTANVSSNSSLMEVQSDSKLNCLENKKKGRRDKNKRHMAVKAAKTDVGVQDVASETKTAPIRMDVPVNVNIITVTEPATHEVEVPHGLSKKMDFVATPVEIEAAVVTGTKVDSVTNLSPSQRRTHAKKKKQNPNSLGHDDIDHDHPEDNSVKKNVVLEKDSSSVSSVKMYSHKQPDGHIKLCLEKNEAKELNDGHNASENKGTSSFVMTNGMHFEKEDVKFAPAVAELDLTIVKEALSGSEKQSNSSKIEDTTLLEKHDVRAENVKTDSRKKWGESSDSKGNTSDCIKEDGTRHNSSSHSEASHITGFSDNKLNIVLELKNDASVQVMEDTMMREASLDFSDCKRVYQDNDNIKKKIPKVEEENLKQKITSEFNETNIMVQKLSCADGVLDENSSSPKEKKSDSIHVLDTFCKHQEQRNPEVETKTEEIFSSSSPLGITKNEVLYNSSKEDKFLQKLHPSPERALAGHCKKKLLVLDVNGLLADIVAYPCHGYKPDKTISQKAVFKRPYCDDFLQFCFERFNVGVWSSRTRKNVKNVVDFLMGESNKKLLFLWDADHCSKTGLMTIENRSKPLVLKELKKLWDKHDPSLQWEKGEYDETNTLLLDDSPYKALRNPAHTAIFPYSYKYKDANDSSLGPGGDLRVYLEGLAAAENVQEYVRQNPFGQRAITESNPSWRFYSQIIETKPSQPRDDTGTSSVASSSVVSRLTLENTSETGFGSEMTSRQTASASETKDNNSETPMDFQLGKLV